MVVLGVFLLGLGKKIFLEESEEKKKKNLFI